MGQPKLREDTERIGLSTLVAAHCPQFSVRMMFDCLNIHPSGIYARFSLCRW